ncbi:MAG: HYR domain-containing protein [Planctomycetota bacterium]|nr:HYR domain-containing protein [Planctomycetota bacterium]
MARDRIENTKLHAAANRAAAICSALFIVVSLIGAPAASADVIYTTLEPPGTIIPPGTLDIDLDNDASADFVLTLGLFGNLTVGPVGNGEAVVAEGAFGVGTARRYLRCETVSGTHNFQGATLPMGGLWVGVENAYIGLRFSIAGETHLGWAHLDVLAGNSSPLLKGYAYNSIPESQLGGDTISPGLTAPPSITCPPDVAIRCDESSDPSQTGMATGLDSCFCPTAVTFEDATAAGACPHAWVITRMWTATDAFGMTTSCDQLITVTDPDVPMLTCPDDVTVECGTSLQTSELGEATATDACDVAPVITYADETSSVCPTVITRTWTAADACGNVATCQQIITVEDTTAPIILDCPVAPDLSCDEACLAALPDLTSGVSATDVCDSELTIEQTPASGTMLGLGVTDVTITITDDCGNSSECPVSVTVADDTPPTIVCPENVTVDAGAGTCTAAPPDLGVPEVDDNCGIDTVTNDAPAIFAVGTITVTWTVTDTGGNAATCEQLVTVRDVNAPTLICPVDVVVECGDATNPANTGGEAVAVDLCDPSPVVAYVDSTLNEATYAFTRTWTATDDSGNVAACEQYIIIRDSTPPVITTCAEDLTLNAGDSGSAALPDLTAAVVVTDNCDGEVVITQNPPAGTVLPLGKTPVTLRATDATGLADACLVTVTVVAGGGDDDPGPGPVPPFEPGFPCGSARYLLSRFLMQSLFGVPICGLGWFTSMPVCFVGLLAIKVRLRRGRRARR